MTDKLATIKFDVFNRWTGRVQFTAEIKCGDDAEPSTQLGLAVKWAVKYSANLYSADLSRADLSSADLSSANLSGADLSRADLSSADLSSSDLSGANLSRADLSGANLSRADLYSADLSGANLSRANLSSADLYSADLYSANLSGADLSGANLSSANLSGADLSGADLSGANLYSAKSADLPIARTRILPEGALIGWKKCCNSVLVKLRIPEEARRSHAFGRKCRAEFADVLEVIGAERGVSQRDGKTEYRVGERVSCDAWSEDWQEECAGGIHFYITRIEAENHY